MQLTEFDENIKSNVMDAMYVIEEIDSYVNKFKKDIKQGLKTEEEFLKWIEETRKK